MNNNFVATMAAAFVKRLDTAGGNDAKIKQTYKILFGRMPTEAEQQLGMQFLKQSANPWPDYVQVLVGSSEFMSVN